MLAILDHVPEADGFARIIAEASGQTEFRWKPVEDGVYITPGFSQDIALWGRNDFDRTFFSVGDLESYGVCDSPAQFMEKFRAVIANDPRPIIAAFAHVAKVPGEQGGWRWHKWGEYVGEGQPTTEYLADEPAFDDGVYCYQLMIVDNVPHSLAEAV